MKPMLSASFRKKVKIVPEKKIGQYLAPGYEQFLPDDMKTGLADSAAIVQDFVTFRRFVERNLVLDLDAEHGGSDCLSVASSHHDAYEANGFPVLLSDNHSSISGHSGISSGRISTNTSACSLQTSPQMDSDDEASIHCDIGNLEMLDSEDIKQPARPELNTVEFTFGDLGD
jgi:hypothetical protein